VIRILIIDDSETDALQLSYLIEQDYSREAKCEHATTRKSALDWLDPTRHAPFDVALVDLNLPDSQGVETFRAIRAAAPSTACVVWSGRRDARDTRDLLIDEGAAGYLDKDNVDVHQVFETLRDAVEIGRTAARLPRHDKLILEESERRAQDYLAEAEKHDDQSRLLQARLLTSIMKSHSGLHTMVARLAGQQGEIQGKFETMFSHMREQQELLEDRIDDADATGRQTVLDLATTKEQVLANRRRIGAIITASATLGFGLGEREAVFAFLQALFGG